MVGWHHWHEFEQTRRWWRTGKPSVLQTVGSQSQTWLSYWATRFLGSTWVKRGTKSIQHFTNQSLCSSLKTDGPPTMSFCLSFSLKCLIVLLCQLLLSHTTYAAFSKKFIALWSLELFDGANLATLDFSQFWMTDVSCLWFVFMAGFFGNPGCVCSLLLPGYRLPFLLQWRIR